VYLYQLADYDKRVIGGLHQDSLGDDLTVVEGLGVQAGLSQAAGVDQLVHLNAHKDDALMMNQ